jgi:hypothetical protein
MSAFDENTKLHFSAANGRPSTVTFGSMFDTDKSVGIEKGNLSIPGCATVSAVCLGGQLEQQS